jgi:hypothetical protein
MIERLRQFLGFDSDDNTDDNSDNTANPFAKELHEPYQEPYLALHDQTIDKHQEPLLAPHEQTIDNAVTKRQQRLGTVITTTRPYIAWKKAVNRQCECHGIVNNVHHDVLVKLQIPANTKVVFPDWSTKIKAYKLRVERAHVDAMWVIDDYYSLGDRIDVASSKYNESFLYQEGKIVTPHKFDDSVYETCTGGIHCFDDQSHAIRY